MYILAILISQVLNWNSDCKWLFYQRLLKVSIVMSSAVSFSTRLTWNHTLHSNNNSIEGKAAWSPFCFSICILFPMYWFEKIFLIKILICVNISTNSITGNQYFKSFSFSLPAEKPITIQANIWLLLTPKYPLKLKG
jgi:hypothetical protein